MHKHWYNFVTHVLSNGSTNPQCTYGVAETIIKEAFLCVRIHTLSGALWQTTNTRIPSMLISARASLLFSLCMTECVWPLFQKSVYAFSRHRLGAQDINTPCKYLLTHVFVRHVKKWLNSQGTYYFGGSNKLFIVYVFGEFLFVTFRKRRLSSEQIDMEYL